MACSLCHHEHKGTCYPNCPVCCPKPAKATVAKPPTKVPRAAAPKVAKKASGGTQSERNRRYREKHRAKYNAYMRAYRKRRADE